MHLPLDAPAPGGSLTVRCRLLAQYEEIVGQGEVTLELPRPSTVLDAVRFLRARVPNGSLLPERPLVAVNLAHALHATLLNDGDELALLPPIAGG
ncbi:MAG: MoaD/ThiS family protein [Gemmatimonadetes bacterium]|nr:MoaD/ThiS family protein [Gemmatimonadota bacterium]